MPQTSKTDKTMMIGKIDVAEQLHQFFFSLLKHREAPQFFRKNHLWKGVWRYGWFTRILIVIVLLVGMNLLMILWRWWWKADLDNLGDAVSSMGLLVTDFAKEGSQYLFMGGTKYVILILMEVFIFHICRRTVAILTGKDSASSFDEFIKAQIRMIRVSIRSWIRESIVILLIGVVFGMAGIWGFMKPVLIFAVQCYYLGFTLIDNYNEQFGLSVKESARYTYNNYVGATLGLGLVLNILLFIPLLGAVIAPFLSAVTATLVMYELSDLHLLESELAVKLDDTL